MRWTATLLGTLLTLAPAAAAPDAQRLTERIDERIGAGLKKAGVPAAPLADDAEFHRRAYLDITGRIPTPHDVRTFLADTDPQKRTKLIDQLLDSPRYASHFADVLRAELIPETAANRGARFFQPGFEAWLRQRLRAGAGYDRIARDLIAAPIAAPGQEPESVYREPDRPNPLAFYAVKDAKPEELASAVARTFLGVRIECAQCHNHPFATWTREQFWSQAAFFAGIERQGDGQFNPLTERTDVREATPPSSKRAVTAAFLDDRKPMWKAGVSPRVALADWVTSPDNPYFARAAANRLWGHLFGVGLVDPVDDFNDENPPSHPELLDELACAFADSGFEVRFLIRSICRSQAYQRTSARTHAGQEDPRLFARMNVKGLTGEQLYDSLLLATGYRDPGGRSSPRQQFLSQFARQGSASAPETSVPQALALMNGRLLTRLTDPRESPTLAAVAETPLLTAEERIETLYLATLSRRPTARELTRVRNHLAGGSEAERLSDVFWALLNAAEFRLNH
jgi:hypothetical protein